VSADRTTGALLGGAPLDANMGLPITEPLRQVYKICVWGWSGRATVIALTANLDPTKAKLPSGTTCWLLATSLLFCRTVSPYQRREPATCFSSVVSECAISFSSMLEGNRPLSYG